ncbi:hypothetical protein [Nocardia seriolae]|uniref:Uncharacterized protein n=1 Tax=Nocardia seriolae TaxID=37332 RepID=A0A0B8NRR6_9NOCA|nr:hypothetical protein [Nocardia seriolae]APA96622.1 hypothetical protein NS506_02559 [Nocardia seriolae]MTJ61680.1 hypothetical protein [Nocardia seriolae]MTJ76497.1 hypothetical protein [Nocardia seriolae]MTJ86693.1 hypothetical protein [Nocardia seriolae]MTK30688.1 hypothetical protein [Nocardia seriolae]
MTAPENAPRSRVPEPALVRAGLVFGTGVAAYFIGHNVDTSWIEAVMTIYGVLSPMVAGLLIRPAVSPFKKPPAAEE